VTVRSIVAIDPGACARIAAFFDRVLVHVDLEDVSSMPVRAVYAPGVVDVVIVERPQVYRPGQTRKPVDPNDLIKLALRAGALAQAFYPREEVIEVLPREWKGQVPPDIMIGRIVSKLTRDESDLVHKSLERHAAALRHNAIDAIGIGLHYLGRL
jgi:hypothetical protein